LNANYTNSLFMGGRIMKKKVGIILALAMIMAGVMATSCFAAGPWYACNVMAVGTSGGIYQVQLQDTAAAPWGLVAPQPARWYTLSSGTAKQLLATGLTGSASSLRVYAYLPNNAAGQTIANLYVISDNFQ
jgi:hypothetical protein